MCGQGGRGPRPHLEDNIVRRVELQLEVLHQMRHKLRETRRAHTHLSAPSPSLIVHALSMCRGATYIPLQVTPATIKHTEHLWMGLWRY